MPSFRPALASLLLLAACASKPEGERLSLHACSLNPGEPQYPDACTQTAPEYYNGSYGYYPPLFIPVIVPPAPPVKPPAPPPPPPKPAPRQEPVHHCPLNADRACP